MPERDLSPSSLYPGAPVLVVEALLPGESTLCEALRQMGHRPATAGSAEAALDEVRPQDVDLVVTDAALPGPGMDGLTLCRALRSHPSWDAVPVVLIGSDLSPEDVARGLDCGADDALRYPMAAAELRARLDRVLGPRRSVRRGSEADGLPAFGNSLGVLTRVCELAEDGGAHARRVGAYAALLAEALGLGGVLVEEFAWAARLHDVGRLGISPALLARRGPLTVQEFEVVKEHTTRGAEILGDSPTFAVAREVALGHHERWDGTGYPRGLAGEATTLPARVTLMADVYDALRRPRPYREPMDHRAAFRVVTLGDWRTSPEHFDPAVLDAFARVHRRFEEVYATLQLSERP